MSSINEARFRAAEFWRNLFAVNPEYGTTIEDMLKEGYWAHVAAKLRPWDKIEVRAEDGSFYAELMVRDAGRNWAKVVLLSLVKFEAVPDQELVIDQNFKVKWMGPHRKWAAIRMKDNMVLKDGMLDKPSVLKYIENHVKAFAA